MSNQLAKKYLALLGFTIFFGYSSGQIVTIETVLDTNQIELGKTTVLKYSVKKNNNDIVLLPGFLDTIYDGIEIIGNILIDSVELNEDQEILEQSIQITSFETGNRYIPAQPFVHIGTSGPDTILSNPAYINVVGVAVDSSGTIRDIADVEWVMPTFKEVLPFIMGFLGIGLIVFLVLYFWRRRNKSEDELKPAKKIEPPHIIALRELDKLKAQKLWQHNQIKEYYTKLTQIIRTYIENQFGVLAMEETTREILQDIKKQGLDERINMRQLEELLNLADLIKFAKGEAQPEENIEQLEVAYTFVKSSRNVYVENAAQEITEKINQQLSSSFSLSQKIKNAKNISDLEIYRRLENGSRLVQYSYTISVIAFTFTRGSKLYLLDPGEKGIKKGIVFSIITILLGWWGIPFGPIRTIISLRTNFSGGKKVQIH
jgi:hypothetical protein